MTKRRKTKKSGKVLLSKNARRKKSRARARDKLVRRHWRGRLTVKGNYQRMGLAADANRVRKKGVGAEWKIVEEMERTADEAKRRQESQEVVYVDWYNKQLLSQLMEKYGTDYEAMSRDIKVNVWQRTPAQLRRQCQRLLRAIS